MKAGFIGLLDTSLSQSWKTLATVATMGTLRWRPKAK